MTEAEPKRPGGWSPRAKRKIVKRTFELLLSFFDGDHAALRIAVEEFIKSDRKHRAELNVNASLPPSGD